MTRAIQPFHSQLLLLLLLLAICVLIYAPGLSGPMLLDDYPQLSPLMEAEPRDWQTLGDTYLFSNSGHLSRPVSMASFIANAVLHGDELRYWKATNLLIHGLTAIIVFFLTRILFRAAPVTAAPGQAGWLALLVAGLWLLHALHVSTVLYTVQRMAQLATLFTLAGLLAYSSGRLRQIRTGGGWWLIAVALLVCLPLAVLSKENGVLLLLLIPLFELTVFRGAGLPGARTGSGRILLSVMLLPVLLGTAYLLLHFDQLVLNGYVSREFTLTERLLTQLRVLVMYLHQLLVPLPGIMGFYHDDIAVSRGLATPPATLWSLLLLAGLLWLAWVLRRRQPLISTGILFFFLAHALESTIFPLELMFEHRNYLASFGVMLAVVALLAMLVRQPKVLAATGVVLLLTWSSLTAVRAGIWGTPSLLMSHMHAVHPASKRLVIIQANRYADAGNYPEALSMLDRYDDTGFYLNRLYVYCLRDGRIADGELRSAAGAIDGVINSHAMTGLIGIANLGLDGECDFSGALFLGLMDAAAAARIRPSRLQKLHLYRAHYLHRLGGVEAALPALEAAFNARQGNPVPLFLATEWLLDDGQPARAAEVYARALASAKASRSDYDSFTKPIEARLAAAGQ